MGFAVDPTREIGKSAPAQAAFACETPALTVPFFGYESQWGKQTEIDIHRLERRRPGINSLEVASGNVSQQGTVRGRCRRQDDFFRAALGGGKPTREQADRSGFYVAFATGDLASEAPARVCFEPQRSVEKFRRVDERVAMQTAQSGKFGVLQAGNGAENADLFGVLKLGLKADHAR